MSKVKNTKNIELLHQKEELDILESIYMEEIDIHNPIPPYKFSVQCRPYLDYSLDEALERFSVKLDIELGLDYPQEAPRCEIKHHVDKITHYEVQNVNKIIEKTAQEMKGTPMLFEIVESIRVIFFCQFFVFFLLLCGGESLILFCRIGFRIISLIQNFDQRNKRERILMMNLDWKKDMKMTKLLSI